MDGINEDGAFQCARHIQRKRVTRVIITWLLEGRVSLARITVDFKWLDVLLCP